MRKKIVAMILLAGILLTGCGAPDAVLDEAENIREEYRFLNSREEVENAKNNLLSERKSEPLTVSVIKRQQLKTLKETIRKDSFLKGLFLEEDEDEDDEFEADETDDANIDEWLGFEVGKKSIDSVFPEDLVLSFRIKDEKKDVAELLERMEKIGYKNMGGYAPEQYGEIVFVRQGMMFRGYVNENIAEDGTVEKSLESFDILVPGARFCYPKKYEELIEKTIGDGFYLLKVHTGGFLDCLTLQSSWNDPGNPYNKQVSFYLKNEKPLQLEVKIGENTDKADGVVFSADERQTIINLITQMTGNSSEATAFVSNFRIDGDTEGTLGNKSWRLLKNGKDGNKSFYILRIQ